MKFKKIILPIVFSMILSCSSENDLKIKELELKIKQIEEEKAANIRKERREKEERERQLLNEQQQHRRIVTKPTKFLVCKINATIFDWEKISNKCEMDDRIFTSEIKKKINYEEDDKYVFLRKITRQVEEKCKNSNWHINQKRDWAKSMAERARRRGNYDFDYSEKYYTPECESKILDKKVFTFDSYRKAYDFIEMNKGSMGY